MFIAHFGVGLGAKKADPGISLGTLFLAAQFLDLLWPTLLLLDVEHAAIKPETGTAQPIAFTDYPISHSLLMVLVWALVFGAIYWLLKKNIKGAAVLFCCVLSHWVLDLIVHLPDLPLYPGNSPLLGLKLWNSFVGTLLVEGIIFSVGLMLYLRNTVARNGIGKYGFYVLVGLLVLVHLGNIAGPAPTDINAVAWGAELQWILVLFAYWIDRNRMAVPAENFKMQLAR